MGEIQETIKKMPYAWNRSDHSDIFYHTMNYASKGIIDASCFGAFKRRSAEEARQLIEDLAKCNYKAPFEASRSSSRLKRSGLIEELGNSSRASSPFLAKPIKECIS